jgi:hypothetical protein
MLSIISTGACESSTLKEDVRIELMTGLKLHQPLQVQHRHHPQLAVRPKRHPLLLKNQMLEQLLEVLSVAL